MEEKDNLNANININKNLKIIKQMLENIVEIMTILKPLIEKVLKLEEAEEYKESGTLKKAASLFGEISNQCREITGISFSENFLKSLKN